MSVRRLEGVRAVLFDVDGTLLDTKEFVLQAFEHALVSHGCLPPSRAALAPMFGMTLLDWYGHFAPTRNPADLIATHRAFQSVNLHLASPFPGVEQALGKLRDSGVKVAAITTRSKHTSLKTLEMAGLDAYLDVVISWEDVTRPKPDAEPLLKALDRLGEGPEAAVMVGDTDVDIEAGRNAGVRTIGLTCGFTGHGISASRPDLVLNGVDEVPLWVISAAAANSA